MLATRIYNFNCYIKLSMGNLNDLCLFEILFDNVLELLISYLLAYEFIFCFLNICLSFLVSQMTINEVFLKLFLFKQL